jgi:hypothetical protein
MVVFDARYEPGTKENLGMCPRKIPHARPPKVIPLFASITVFGTGCSPLR